MNLSNIHPERQRYKDIEQYKIIRGAYLPYAINKISEGGGHKIAYFAFALEAACGALPNTLHYSEVVEVVAAWFEMEIEDADEQVEIALPSEFMLHANYPNPFNPETMISFDVGTRSRVVIRVFDLLGREVSKLVDRRVSPGTHSVSFSGANLASGIYLVNMQADNFSDTRRMVLMK